MRKKFSFQPNDVDTLIGEGTTITGDVRSQASIRVEGKVIGDIHCEGDVTIGHKGETESNVVARNVHVAGNVAGSVTTAGMLTITHTGVIIGDICARSLHIAEGGRFQGISMMEAPETEAIQVKPKEKERKSHLHKVEKEAVSKAT